MIQIYLQIQKGGNFLKLIQINKRIDMIEIQGKFLKIMMIEFHQSDLLEVSITKKIEEQSAHCLECTVDFNLLQRTTNIVVENLANEEVSNSQMFMHVAWLELQEGRLRYNCKNLVEKDNSTVVNIEYNAMEGQGLGRAPIAHTIY